MIMIDREVDIDLGNGRWGVVSNLKHSAGVFLGTPFVKYNDAFMWSPKKWYFSKTFYFRDTMGLPLSFIFDSLQIFADERNHPITPCLHQFRADALFAGWSERKISADIREALGEVFEAKKAVELMSNYSDVLFVPKTSPK
jgi:hypothetical protein